MNTSLRLRSGRRTQQSRYAGQRRTPKNFSTANFLLAVVLASIGVVLLTWFLYYTKG